MSTKNFYKTAKLRDRLDEPESGLRASGWHDRHFLVRERTSPGLPAVAGLLLASIHFSELERFPKRYEDVVSRKASISKQSSNEKSLVNDRQEKEEGPYAPVLQQAVVGQPLSVFERTPSRYNFSVVVVASNEMP